jgi:hypothetical protein
MVKRIAGDPVLVGDRRLCDAGKGGNTVAITSSEGRRLRDPNTSHIHGDKDLMTNSAVQLSSRPRQRRPPLNRDLRSMEDQVRDTQVRGSSDPVQGNGAEDEDGE